MQGTFFCTCQNVLEILWQQVFWQKLNILLPDMTRPKKRRGAEKFKKKKSEEKGNTDFDSEKIVPFWGLFRLVYISPCTSLSIFLFVMKHGRLPQLGCLLILSLPSSLLLHT